uniref:Uncharacterized protein n=1 Tax=Brassica campestris TaxID=3711 RepID=A0A3P6BJG1_BRACM|nr:unnamed protein product [Brassica rapa]
MITLDHSTCSLTGTVSSRPIVGVHLEVSHHLNRSMEEVVWGFTAHLHRVLMVMVCWISLWSWVVVGTTITDRVRKDQ